MADETKAQGTDTTEKVIDETKVDKAINSEETSDEVKAQEADNSKEIIDEAKKVPAPYKSEEISKEGSETESREPKKIENLEKALRVFKRKSAGIISEVRKREAYDSPSVKRKKKSKEARRKKRMGNKFGNRY